MPYISCSTLLQSKPRTGEPLNNQLQIIHSCGDHWILPSTVGCTDTEPLLHVYDSVYKTLNKDTTDLVFVLLRIFSLGRDQLLFLIMQQRQQKDPDGYPFAWKQ